MAGTPESPAEHLWSEYARAFAEYDDHRLARWLAQTLSQLEGKVWRLSHPLVSAYRLAAQVGHDRQIWLKKLATAPAAYPEAPCCRAPLLPLLTRDVLESGLVCEHCGGTAVPFDELPAELQPAFKQWYAEYDVPHSIAHWEDQQKRSVPDYERALDNAAEEAIRLLRVAGTELAPPLLDYYPAIVWEDQDECLEIRPDEITL